MTAITADTHLWEVDHPYYCNEGNYYASSADGLGPQFKTFATFLAEWGDANLDMNLVFRWDWTEGGDQAGEPFNGDVNYRNGVLKVFIMGQRKGLYNWATVEVCRADEPAVRDYLLPRLQRLMDLWSPMIRFAPDEPMIATVS
jgi:hypothetical protein